MWLRGKYDYRSCIHGPDFKPVLPNYIGIPTCFARDGEDGKHIVTATRGGAVAEGILTWEEEWRQIQLERLQEVVAEMGTWGTEWQEGAVRAMLERLKKLEVTLAVSTGVEDLLVVERALTEQLEGWLVEIEGEVEGEAGSEVEDGAESGAEGGVSGVTGDGVQLGTGSVVGTSGQRGAVSAVRASGQTGAGSTVSEERIGNEGLSEAVEVPALGEVEQRSGFPWWVLVVLLVTGSGLAGWLLYGRKRRERR